MVHQSMLLLLKYVGLDCGREIGFTFALYLLFVFGYFWDAMRLISFIGPITRASSYA